MELFPGDENRWLHFTALAHDLGKVLALKISDDDYEALPHWQVRTACRLHHLRLRCPCPRACASACRRPEGACSCARSQVVGDIFPVGLPMRPECVFSHLWPQNPDSAAEWASRPLGLYEEGCGFEKVLFGFSHDECGCKRAAATCTPDGRARPVYAYVFTCPARS